MWVSTRPNAIATISLYTYTLFLFPVPDCPDRMVTHNKVSQEVSKDRQNLQGTLNPANYGKPTKFGTFLSSYSSIGIDSRV